MDPCRMKMQYSETVTVWLSEGADNWTRFGLESHMPQPNFSFWLDHPRIRLLRMATVDR